MLSKTKLHFNLYSKILGFLIKKGKKQKALRFFNKMLLNLSIEFNMPAFFILYKVCILLNIFVETRKLKIKGRWHYIPFPVTIRRRNYLIIKFMLSVLRDKPKKKSFFEILEYEIYSICSGLKSHAYNQKIMNNQIALVNRSNMHYRW